MGNVEERKLECVNMAKLLSCCLLIFLLGIKESITLRGNYRRLGEQCDASVKTDVLYSVPQPLQFYEEFVKENKPVVFKGAIRGSRAYKYWTEDYLITEYGNLTVRLEAKSEKNRHIPEGAISLGMDLIGNFLGTYQDTDGYVISQIPVPMEKDVLIPPCLRCGSFKNSIQEVHLFLSASGGKTALHKDPYNNIHCVFNGTKDWILIHPDQSESLYMSDDSLYEWGGISDVNPDDVDLALYPKIAEVKISKLRLHRGDCIFMPSGYWHQVRSFGHMNTAVAIWFSIIDSFDRTGCDGQLFDFAPMNTIPIIWRYSGFGNLTQGHMDIYVLKKALLLWADKETGRINLMSFVDHFVVLLDSNSKNRAMNIDIKRRRDMFLRYFGPENYGYTTTDFIHGMTIENLKGLVEIIHPNDLSNTDVLEYGHLSANNIVKIIMESLYQNGTFDTARFLEHYRKVLGGTKTKGLEIIHALDIPKDGLVSQQHLFDRLDFALKNYTDAIIHDPATERQLFKFLKLGRRSSSIHDEL